MERLCVPRQKILDFDIRRLQLCDFPSWTTWIHLLHLPALQVLPVNLTILTGLSNSWSCCLDQTRYWLWKSFLFKGPYKVTVRDTYKDPQKHQPSTRPVNYGKRIILYLLLVFHFLLWHCLVLDRVKVPFNKAMGQNPRPLQQPSSPEEGASVLGNLVISQVKQCRVC